MPDSLYIHSHSCILNFLQDFFGQVGIVKYADVLREGGIGSRSKGCGIVEFETPEEAAAAIEKLNHAELDGRQIFVREDREDFELRGESAPMALRGGEARPPPRTRQRTDRSTPPPLGGGFVSIGRRVWVGNLSFETSWQQLKDHFKVAGHVLHADIMQDVEGRSKGCGIVEFEHPADALRAISLLSNSTLNERQIMVREDREDPGARGGPSGVSVGAVHAGPAAPEGTQIVVHGLPFRMAWQDLKDLCRAAGTVVRADVMTNPDGTSKGYGVVAFATQQDAAQAIAMLNGRVVEGRVITCKFDRFTGGQ
jgi:RNA recognition motif-containing protein